MPIVSIREVTTTQGGKKKKRKNKGKQVSLTMAVPAVRNVKRKSKGRPGMGSSDPVAMRCCQFILCGIANAFGQTELSRLPTGAPMRTHIEKFKVRLDITADANGNVTLLGFPGLPGGLIVVEGIVKDLPTIDGASLSAVDANLAGGNLGVPFAEWIDPTLAGSTNVNIGTAYRVQEARCLGFGLKVLPTGSVLNMTGEAVVARQHVSLVKPVIPVVHSYNEPLVGAVYAAPVPTVSSHGFNSVDSINFSNLSTSYTSEVYSLVPGVDKKGTGRYMPGTCENFGKFTKVSDRAVVGADSSLGANTINNTTMVLTGGTRLPISGNAVGAWGGLISSAQSNAVLFHRGFPVGSLSGVQPVGMHWMEDEVNVITWAARGCQPNTPFSVEFGVNLEMVLDPVLSPRRKDLMPTPPADDNTMRVAQSAQQALPLSAPPGVVDKITGVLGEAASHPYVRQLMAEGSRRWADNLYRTMHGRLFNDRGPAGTGYWGDALGLE